MPAAPKTICILANLLLLTSIASLLADTPKESSPIAAKDESTSPEAARLKDAPARIDDIVSELTYVKDDATVDYRPVPLSAQEISARAANNPKADGALLMSQLDLTGLSGNDPAAPNFYYYHGQPIPLELHADRLAIRTAEGVDLNQASNRTEQAIGLAITATEPTGVDRLSFVKLSRPLTDCTDATAKIESAIQTGRVEFASPVFKSPLIPDGWIIIAPDILVRFKSQHATRAAGALAELAQGYQIKEQNFGGMPDAFRLSGTPKNGFDVLAAANRLAQDPRVKWAEPEMTFSGLSDIYPNDTEFGSLWGIENTGQGINGTWGTNDMDMDGNEAWNVTRGNSGVQVLVIDTGVQQDHPDINQNAGRDFTTGAADGIAGGGPANACDNHGTAVAGCISARFNNSLGVVGIAPLCRVVSARCMIANTPTCGPGWTTNNTWTVNALNWAVNSGIEVTNNSNAYGASSTAIDDAYLNAYENGLTHFASTGNSGAASIAYPASADTVNAVGNLTQTGARNATSQYGTGIDFSAPGTNIRTTDRTGSAGYDTTGDYAWVNGTSFASPYAAGVAALVKVAHPSWNPINIETAIKSGATDLGSNSYDTTFGWGMVNAHRAITIFGPVNDECTDPIIITGTSYNPGSIFTYSATTSDYYEPSESCEAGNVGVSNSVWYSYTPPANGTIDVNTWGSNYDTVVSVFDGCGIYIGTLPIWFPNQLACNDDINGTLQSEILGVPVNGGQEYKIKVSDYNTASGGGELFFDLYFHYGAPANDSCLNRTPIPGAPGTNHMPAVYTGAATVSPGTCTELWEYGCGHPDGNSNSVYYSFVPTTSGSLTVDTFGSNYDTVLMVVDGAGFSNPCGEYWQGRDGPICVNPIDFGYYVCNDDSGGVYYYQSLISNYPVNAGWPYVIKVSDYNPNSGGGWLYLNTTLVAAPMMGDVNGDGAVNVSDVPYMVNAQIDPGNCPGCNMGLADMNGDTLVNGGDLQLFVNAILGI